MIPEKECRKSWKCPSDRELCLRAKLNAGWSVHSSNLFRKIEHIPPSELQSIENVIQRAKDLEQMEVERVGRMIYRLENMTMNAMGDGRTTCSMCGMAFGLFRSSFVYCTDCAKAVCEKCRVDTFTSSHEVCMLCKICAENREIWKKSGGWFYGRFPSLTEECQKERVAQISASPIPVRGFDTWAHRARDIVRMESFEPPEENHNENTSYKDWSRTSTPIPDIGHLKVFEPPEGNRNENSSYKDSTMGSTSIHLKVFEPPEGNRNENSSYKDSSMDSTSNTVHLKVFEPVEGNRNENSSNRNWSMGSTPNLNSLKNDEASNIELESSKKNYSDKNKSDFHFLTIQSSNLSSSCPALTELQEPSKLKRKPSIRRKKTATKTRNINNAPN